MSEILSGHSPKASDIFIAVMGMTGSGKSTFISLCTGQDVPVGHNLQACTQQVTVYKCQWSTNADVYLFDTPGFDDTNRSDTEVLIEIAACLAKTYEDNFRLSGILYLHRITDRRIGGSAKRNLFMFRKLCGKDGLNNVLLVTTMWEDEQPEKGHSREAELIATNGFWGALVEEGAEVKRHDNTRASAMTLLKVVAKKNRVAISIQKEMVSERKNLNETEAGMGLNSEILLAEKRVKKEMELALEMEREARRLHDEKSAEEQRQYRKKMQQKFDHLNQEREKLKVSLKEIKEQRFMYKELEAKYEKSQELMLQQAERIGTLEGQHQQRDKDIILRDQQTSRELEILRLGNFPVGWRKRESRLTGDDILRLAPTDHGTIIIPEEVETGLNGQGRWRLNTPNWSNGFEVVIMDALATSVSEQMVSFTSP
ncbi:hypothetical protein NW762_005489 [Fusarium torreyae]|uniref:G domain-containing protein n=1 Tax=Fusarium torreyae TaxID=1237075 RepID=A0A9W8S567_9HYPO|nr:hypothetical protein NW762_005489 [Fusarium torreyae]